MRKLEHLYHPIVWYKFYFRAKKT